MRDAPETPARFRVVACEVFFREISALAAASPRPLDVEFVPQGLHDLGAGRMRERLQAAVDAADPKRHAAVLLAYGLCGNGLAGLAAPAVPLVVPRAHDCITCLLGSRARYDREFAGRPGTYWRSSGWIERAGPPGEAGQLSFGGANGAAPDRAALVARFGEEDAAEIMAVLTSHLKSYDRLAYIRMGIEPAGELEGRARAEAQALGWSFETVEGDLGLLRRLLDGPWDVSEFLVVPPGRRIRPAYDGSIIAAEAS